jgi:predicted dehydrogenase
MDLMPLRFAIIGCGRIAPRHAQSLLALTGRTQLIAVADVIESRARHIAHEYGAQVIETDYRYLLERKDIDVICVCTPSGLHAEMGINALQAGKHAIVEKPMAMTLADADAMLIAAQNNNRSLTIVLQNRYNSPMQAAKQAIQQGRLGKLVLGNATVRWYRPQSYYDDGWHGTRALDGGALMNQSIHHIDALQWLMGDVASVHARTTTLVHKMEMEDIGVATWQFTSGALGVIEGSTVTYPENLEGSVAVFGTQGSIKVGGTALNRRTIWKLHDALEEERLILAMESVDPPSVYGQSHLAVFSDTVEAIRSNRQPLTDGNEGRRSLALVLAMYASSVNGAEVFLDHG